MDRDTIALVSIERLIQPLVSIERLIQALS
jgi:hypothetical protein